MVEGGRKPKKVINVSVALRGTLLVALNVLPVCLEFVCPNTSTELSSLDPE